MATIEIFDPALCCATGVCGPSVDPELTRIATAIFLLEKRGIDIKRYNLANDAQFFVNEIKVQQLLEEKGIDVLPVVLVNKEVKKLGDYPTNDELEQWTGIPKMDLDKKEEKSKGISLL
ncbi:arsenite efflux transporter metallochaperone ArsD [Aquibacillus halophilus]|uniref:Arsenite efflux transporter metallochaperone ArsD n=1 Tax=Aquibacillus halophilus TaxID=930132 RepID=A0A6A8DD96_9BACI|nr:arsenite efflux transporter metallochaperone ArsD [Aquibacillus halophilus]MRH43554.1 arsenite efflux transporter metallochaperone ArsD [Aquibacillus halophilus]